MKFITLLIITLVSAFCVSCGKQEIECPIILDQVSIIDQQDFNGTTYYLVERISGWHEKTIIIELFDQKPEFDRCNESIMKPIVDELVSTDLEVKSFSIDLEKRQYEIDYGGQSESIMQTSKFKIKFK